MRPLKPQTMVCVLEGYKREQFGQLARSLSLSCPPHNGTSMGAEPRSSDRDGLRLRLGLSCRKAGSRAVREEATSKIKRGTLGNQRRSQEQRERDIVLLFLMMIRTDSVERRDTEVSFLCGCTGGNGPTVTHGGGLGQGARTEWPLTSTREGGQGGWDRTRPGTPAPRL